MRKLIFLSSLVLLASSCDVTIPNIVVCSAKTDNIVRDGAVCATTLSGEVWDIDAAEYLAKLPVNVADERPGAIVMTADDFNAYKTALDQACRALGKKCKRAVKDSIENLKDMNLEEEK